MQQVLWSVRPAASSEWFIALNLIPEVLSSVKLPDTLFVVSPCDSPDTIVACGVAIPIIKDVNHPGFPFYVRVTDAYQKKGIGKLLIQVLADYVRSWNVPYLLGMQAYANGTEHAFLTACGFCPYLKVHCFEVKRETAHILLSILDKVKQRNLPNAKFNIVSLTKRNYQQVISLYCMHFMVSYEMGQLRLENLIQSPMVDSLSAIAYFQDQPVGFIIGYLDQDQVPKVDFWMTAPSARNSHIALYLLCFFVKNAYDLGFEAARFDSNDDAKSTLKIAARLNAETIKLSQSFALAVD